jgi:hypothetical protein
MPEPTPKIHLTVEGKPVSEEDAKKVHQALKEALKTELAKHGHKLGGMARADAFEVSGHGRGAA